METFSSAVISDIAIVLAVLESGNSVELPAMGYSMFPTLRPGDKVLVRPLDKGEVPVEGSVVVCLKKGVKAQRYSDATQQDDDIPSGGINDILVMHRLIGIKDRDSGNPIFITRGDSLPTADLPWTRSQLLGIAVSFERGRKEYAVKTVIVREWRYSFNRRLLWLKGMLKRTRASRLIT
jgi:hypothetical protein